METRRDFLTLSGTCGSKEEPSVTTMEFNVRDGFPDVPADAHNGDCLRFYEDRIRNKAFVVNFMSIRDEHHIAVTENLAKTIKLLGDKVGREVFVTSISVDPEYDTLERLAEFAKKYDAPDGWSFLRVQADDAATLSQRMYHFNRGAGMTSRLVFYGNGYARVWGSYPALILPEDAASRINWVLPKKKPVGLVRAGPSKPGQNPNPWNNRAI